MLFMVAQELGFIYYPVGYTSEDNRQFHLDSEGELKNWSQWDESMQAKRFSQRWIQSPQWLDVYAKPPRQWWYDSDWKPLAGCAVLVEYLRRCRLEQPYSIASLLDALIPSLCDPVSLKTPLTSC
jgi:hypothetical protein